MSAATELLQKGRYRIDSSTAYAAGSSAVMPAYDTTSDTKVYVKEIVVKLGKVTTLSQQENSRLAFENAAKRISEFQHEALIKVKDYYSEVGRQYLVIESVDGDDLQADAERHPAEKVLDWADQILDAVNYLHNQKVIHGSVCPKNVRVTPSGKVKLLGLTIKDDTGNDLSTSIADVDDGTLNFSPLEIIWEGLDAASQKVIVNSYDEKSERVLKEAPDARSDIYSVGATIYFLLTGRVPVDPLERSIELLEGNRDPLASPNSIDSQIAPEVSDVVMRALEIKRENRFDSVMIMRQVLRTSVVRAKEREATEAQDMNEASELMRNTQQLKMPEAAAPPPAMAAEKPAPPPPAKAAENPAPVAEKVEKVAKPQGPTEAEILAQKLKEAEEMRLEAERKMAEAERMMREQEAERVRLEAQAKAIHSSTETKPKVAAEDDLLGISIEPVKTSPTAVQHNLEESDEDIHLSIKPAPKAKIDLREIAKASEPEKQVVAETKPEPAPAAPEKITQPAAVEPEPYLLDEVEHDSSNDSLHDTATANAFSGSYVVERSKPAGLPIPLIAAVAGAILIVAFIGFIFVGGSSSSTQEQAPAQTQQQEAAIPAAQSEQQAEQQPAAQPEQVNTFNETQPVVETPAAATETRPAVKPTATPKKAPEAAKTPAPKKPVTVDDLINDN